MNIALYCKAFQESYISALPAITAKLKSCGSRIYVNAALGEFVRSRGQMFEYDGVYTNSTDLPEDTDFVLSIGGDGTLLSTVSIVGDSGIPVAGINSGRLGFLSSISASQAGSLIDSLVEGNYTISERSLIKLLNPWGAFLGGNDCALNELTIQKDGAQLMLTHVYCNGEFMNTYRSDGLIVSTPTGSTAYSMSVGGPIVSPSSRVLIVSPISPHNLNIRPLIIPDDSQLLIKTECRNGSFITTLDSKSQSVDCSTEIRIGVSRNKFKLIEPPTGYFATLRNKLMLGVDYRN